VHYKIDTHKKGGADSYGKTGPIYESQDSTSSYSSEYKKALTDSSILTVGAAYNSAKVSKANNENVSAIASYFANTGAGTSQAITNINKNAEFSHGSASSFDPMIKIDTKIDSTMSIYGGIAKKSRIPNLKDRYSTRLDRYIPNPDLSMESTINYEVGATKKFKDGSVKMSLFYAKAKDFIQAIAVNVYRTAALANANVASNRMLQNQNIGDVTQKGFEIEGSYIVSDKLSFDGSYTKLSMKNDTDSSKKITDVPSDKVVIASVYSPLSILTWTNSFEFDSRRLDTNGNSSNVEATWNTKAIYKATKALSLEAGVNNVLDRNYYVQYGYPEAGRVYYGNVKYKF
jgi:iron complex outermembrane receptor protein